MLKPRFLTNQNFWGAGAPPVSTALRQTENSLKTCTVVALALQHSFPKKLVQHIVLETIPGKRTEWRQIRKRDCSIALNALLNTWLQLTSQNQNRYQLILSGVK